MPENHSDFRTSIRSLILAIGTYNWPTGLVIRKIDKVLNFITTFYCRGTRNQFILKQLNSPIKIDPLPTSTCSQQLAEEEIDEELEIEETDKG